MKPQPMTGTSAIRPGVTYGDDAAFRRAIAAEGRPMLNVPDNSDLSAWHLYFAKTANNRAWQLSVEPRDGAGDREMLDAAHASAWHWQIVGTEIQRMRSAMLLAEVHAALGHGATAMRYAVMVRDYFLGKPDTPDWEIAFTHLVYAHAAHATGDAAAHRNAYEEARRAVGAIAEGEDRDIVLASLRQVPAP